MPCLGPRMPIRPLLIHAVRPNFPTFTKSGTDVSSGMLTPVCSVPAASYAYNCVLQKLIVPIRPIAFTHTHTFFRLNPLLTSNVSVPNIMDNACVVILMVLFHPVEG